MPARAFEGWSSSDQDYSSDDGDLVDVLESYTRELGVLCGGLEQLQLQDEDEDPVEFGADTLASLEEMAGECATLLACLEAGEHGYEEADEEASDLAIEVGIADNVCLESKQEEDQCETPLALELDSFADELNGFLSCLGDPSPCLIDNAAPDVVELHQSAYCTDKMEAAMDTAAVLESGGIEGKCNGNHDAFSSRQEEVFSKRTKKAIARHVNRLAFRKQQQGSSGKQAVLDYANELRAGAKQERAAGAQVTWSKFQRSSFQQHITRQTFARRRVKQIQEAQRLVESSRLRGTIGTPHHRPSKSKERKSDKKVTYLEQLKPTSSPSSEFDPRYLCAVYLYGLRRLGTTFITFSSLAQLEHRVRARFAMHEVVSIYREVTELVLPEQESGLHTNKRHRLKRLQRISSLEHVNDGDTLCVTQNAYDDMTILCDWMKQRQRVLHGFQYEAPQLSSVVLTTTSEELAPPKPKPSMNVAAKPQLWDSNGRSIGVLRHSMRFRETEDNV